MIGKKVQIISYHPEALIMEGKIAKNGRAIKYIGETGKIVSINKNSNFLNYEILMDKFRPLPLLFSKENFILMEEKK